MEMGKKCLTNKFIAAIYLSLGHLEWTKKRREPMTKADFIAKLSEKTGFTKKDAEKAVNSFMDVVKDALVNGEKVSLVGFGTFEVIERSARKGRNPQTGDEITIAACKAPKFKPGKGLKEAIA